MSLVRDVVGFDLSLNDFCGMLKFIFPPKDDSSLPRLLPYRPFPLQK